MKKQVEIFWTGGYDSTFRICQLSQKNVIIIPYYMSQRSSEEYELNAINKIRNKLLNNKNTKAEIREIIIVDGDKYLNEDKQTNIAHEEILKKDFLGRQYIYLANFAKSHKGVELSIHKDDVAIRIINKYGSLKIENSEYGEYFIIDRQQSNENIIKLFGDEHFPLAQYTKLQMRDEFIKMGLEDIIDDTWFCYHPIDGKPCGECLTCAFAIQEGMSFRFSEEALQRYKYSTYNIYQKIKERLDMMKIDADECKTEISIILDGNSINVKTKRVTDIKNILTYQY